MSEQFDNLLQKINEWCPLDEQQFSDEFDTTYKLLINRKSVAKVRKKSAKHMLALFRTMFLSYRLASGKISPNILSLYDTVQPLILECGGCDTAAELRISDFSSLSSQQVAEVLNVAYSLRPDYSKDGIATMSKSNLKLHNSKGVVCQEASKSSHDSNGICQSLLNSDAALGIEYLCRRFGIFVRQLQRRRKSRPTLDLSDEYDVQYLLAAILRLHFDDVRSEEWVPSYAGKSSRMDFLLKQEKVVVETKMTRAGLGTSEIGDQLIIDISKYKIHPECVNLVCFIYDPDHRLENPAQIENDLSGLKDGIQVRVIVSN